MTNLKYFALFVFCLLTPASFAQSGTGIISDPDSVLIIDTTVHNPVPTGIKTCTRSGGIVLCN